MKTLKTLKKLIVQSNKNNDTHKANYYSNLENVYKNNDALLKTLIQQNK